MFLSKRGKTYHLFFTTADGKRHHRSTGVTTKAEALKFFRQFNGLEEERRRALRNMTLEAFRSSYIAFSKDIHTPKTVRSTETAFREFIRFLGPNVMLGSVRTEDCERFIAKKASEASVWTARKYYLALSACFHRARLWGHILENPWRDVTKPKAPERIPLFLTRVELKLLLSVVQQQVYRDIFTVAAFTGLRLGELVAMRWDWIDFKRRVITVQNSEGFTTKSKKSRVVPMCDTVSMILEVRLRAIKEECALVFHRAGFPLVPDSVSQHFKRAVLRAGLDTRLHFHSLRHSFASWLVQEGVSLFQVARLLGHSSTAVTEIYAHLVLSDMHGILAPLAFEN